MCTCEAGKCGKHIAGSIATLRPSLLVSSLCVACDLNKEHVKKWIHVRIFQIYKVEMIKWRCSSTRSMRAKLWNDFRLTRFFGTFNPAAPDYYSKNGWEHIIFVYLSSSTSPDTATREQTPCSLISHSKVTCFFFCGSAHSQVDLFINHSRVENWFLRFASQPHEVCWLEKWEKNMKTLNILTVDRFYWCIIRLRRCQMRPINSRLLKVSSSSALPLRHSRPPFKYWTMN